MSKTMPHETEHDQAQGRHLMQRELEEQPDILASVASALDEAATDLRPNPGNRVWAGGCGDSLFAAEALAPHFREAGLRFRPASAAEMLWEGEIETGDTVIAISISGSTRRTIEALVAARDAGARTVAVTIAPASALAEAAHSVLVLPYVPISRSIPHGLDYHVTILALAALAAPVSDLNMRDLFARETESALRKARSIVADLSREARFFFLGAGAAARGTSAFAAAKLHEAGGIPAFSFEAENFCHGAQFTLRAGDVVGLFGAGGPSDRRTRALVSGLTRLGCSVFEAGFVDDPDPGKSLRAALIGALNAQALCLAVAGRFDLDVMNPAGDTGANTVQKEWFSWQA